MKNKVVVFLMIFLAIGVVSGKSKKKSSKAAPVPDWVLDPSAVYPAARYLTAIGEGGSRTQAQNAAIANLAAIFKQNVSASASSKTNMSSNGESSALIQTASNSDTKLPDLIGVEIKGAYQTGRTWSAIAVIEKQSAATMYRTSIEKNDVDVKNIVATAQKSDPTMAVLLSLNSAFFLAQKNELSLQRLDVIDAAMAGAIRGGLVSSADVYALLQTVAAATPIFITCDEDKFRAALKAAVFNVGIQTTEDEGAKYNLTMDVIFDNVSARNGKTFNCNWNVTIALKEGAVAIYSYNKVGRTAGLNESSATLKADNDIIALIKGDFKDDFSKYLSNGAY